MLVGEKFALPSEPADLYEIVAWSVGLHEVEEHRWRFHVQRSCEEVLGVKGVPWVLDWEVIAYGHCQGRISGWEAIRQYLEGDTFLYLDRALAQAEYERRVREKLGRLEEEIRVLRSLNPWLE